MKLRPIKHKSVDLKHATVRDFSGGWDILDDENNLATKYSRRLYNCSILADQSVTVRYGVELFVDLRASMSSPARIVNVEYYNAALIVVCSNGDILSVLGDRTVTRIWDAAIASELPGSPAGWSTTDFCSFAIFNGELIICNGVDKPLIIGSALTVDYLQDLAAGTNINTPVCRYVTVCGRYLIMAGDPVNIHRVHISSMDTSGTWYGDGAPNDGTYIDVGSYIPNTSAIRGIRSFRGKLIIAYTEGMLIGDVGLYDDSTPPAHTPQFNETVEQYGTISHRSMLNYGDDMLMMDLVGVPTLKKTIFSGTIRPERVSELIDPEITTAITNLSFGTLEDRCFSVYNQRDGQFLFFVPNADTLEETTQTTVYAYVFRPSLQIKAWSRFDGWNFTCGCRSGQGNLFFGDADGKLWLYGSEQYPIHSDFVGDPSVNSGEGNPISFDWELPWSDVNKRTKVKVSKYLALDTSGTGEFIVEMYTDKVRYGEGGVDAPLLQMEMTGGDTGGFGEGDQPYGGGRATADSRLYSWPAKFVWMKFRFRGQVTEPLKFSSISLMYQEGSIYR